MGQPKPAGPAQGPAKQASMAHQLLRVRVCGLLWQRWTLRSPASTTAASPTAGAGEEEGGGMAPVLPPEQLEEIYEHIVAEEIQVRRFRAVFSRRFRKKGVG